jgi:hypothetical protein
MEAVWNAEELEAMYKSEGKSQEDSHALAETLCREIQTMVSRDRYSWRKCRSHELTGFSIDEMGCE